MPIRPPRLPHLWSAVLVAVVATAGVLLWHAQIVAHLWEADLLYFLTATAVLTAVLFVASFWRPEYAAHGAELCPGLGILGSVTGFAILLSEIGSTVDVAALSAGLAVAIYSTGAGIVGAMLLYLQKLALDHEALRSRNGERPRRRRRR